MQIEIVEKGNEAELLIEGRLDTSTARDASTVFEDAANRFDKITLNMKELTYCSSAGIRAIRQLYKILKAKEGKMETVNVSDQVMSIFEMTGITALLSLK
jgi:anti-sigma B factor antagonist